MLKGVCPKCGATYYGWSLKRPDQQRCKVCGSKLLVYDESLETTEEGRQEIEKKRQELLHSQGNQKDS